MVPRYAECENARRDRVSVFQHVIFHRGNDEQPELTFAIKLYYHFMFNCFQSGLRLIAD